MEREVNILEFGDKIYKFSHTPFDAEVDMDDLTWIHYDNLIGEIITIPTLMNRVGILQAEAQNAVSTVKLEHSILEAKKSEFYRVDLTTSDGTKFKYPTVSQLENAVSLDEKVSASKRNYFHVVKQANIVDSLYWAIKAKQQKIQHLSQSITPKEFEEGITEGTINGILIKKIEKKF